MAGRPSADQSRRQLRVLFLSEYYPPAVHGGGELSCAALAENLGKAGVSVTVLTSRVARQPIERRERGVLVIRKLSTGSMPGSAFSNLRRAVGFRSSLLSETRKLLQTGAFDVVHCFNMTTIPVIALRSEFSVPFIAHVNSLLFACPKGDLLYHGKDLCTIHCVYRTFVPCLRASAEVGKLRNSPFIAYNPIALSTIYARYFNLKRLLPQFDHLVAISTFIRERLVFAGVQKHNISVLHNIIDLQMFSAAAKRATRRSRRPTRLLFVGTLSVAKGVPELLTALRGMQGDWQCDIYGDGPLESEVAAAADPRIQLHPRVARNSLPTLYRETDIILFPSRWPEPFGRVAVEAMAAGKPIITTRAGGITDIVATNTGVLIPPGDPPMLRKAILSLMRDPVRRSRLANAGKRHVWVLFAPKHLTAQMLHIYQTIIQR